MPIIALKQRVLGRYLNNETIDDETSDRVHTLRIKLTGPDSQVTIIPDSDATVVELRLSNGEMEALIDQIGAAGQRQ